MLRVTLEKRELYDEDSGEFIVLDEVELNLEHSLVSLSKWESKHQKPFLSDQRKTTEEVISYIEMMVVGDRIDEQTLNRFSSDDIQRIQEHIGSSQTATTFGGVQSESEKAAGRAKSGSVVTSELIYYWMTTFGIPFECEQWHLNRLLTLIKICSLKNTKQKKMPKHEVARQYRDLNEKRKRQLGTKG